MTLDFSLTIIITSWRSHAVAPVKPAWVPLAQKSALTATVVDRTFAKNEPPLAKPIERRVSSVCVVERKSEPVVAAPVVSVEAVPVAPVEVQFVAAPIVAAPAALPAVDVVVPAVVSVAAPVAPVAAAPPATTAVPSSSASRGGAGGGKAKLKVIYGVFVNKDAGSAMNAVEVLRELGDGAEWSAPEVQRTLNQLVTLKLLQRDGDKWCVKTTGTASSGAPAANKAE